jgi:hypothetical protein
MILQPGFKGDVFNNVIVTSLTGGTGVCLLYQGSLGSNIYNNVIKFGVNFGWLCVYVLIFFIP